MNDRTRSTGQPSRPTARRTVNSPKPLVSADALDGLPTKAEDGAPADAVEPTDDLPSLAGGDPTEPTNALRVALNRPISLAEVRSVQSQQSAIASEATHVGPTK